MRVVYLGTPRDAVAPLRALHDAGHDVALVVTQPDRKRGRGGALVPSPVKVAAEELGLAVATPARAREVVEDVRASGAEVGVVVAFGQILPTALLEALPHGFVNLHFSLLPRWRGAAPVERAILAGDAETGVDIMAIEAGLDTGPVFASARTPIDPTETAGELHARLVGIGTELLLRTLPEVPSMQPTPQRRGAHLRREAHRRRVRARPGCAGGRSRAAGARRQPEARCLDRRRREAAEGVARARGLGPVRARRGPAGGEAADAVRRVARRPPRRGTVRVTVTTPRGIALDTLVQVEDGAYANVLLPGLLRATGLEQRERAQTTELVYGTLRRRRSLDALLEPVLDRDLDDLDPLVRAALRLGTYQLVEGVAAHAAVGETVGALGRVAPRAKGYVNAVLRKVAGLGPPWPWPEGDSVEALGVRTSMPDWIVARLVADLGVDDARAALEIANEPAALTLRVNRLRATPAAVAEELVATGASVEWGRLLEDALVVRGGGDPARIAAVADGRATPQDQGSQAVAAAVGARPEARVLEVGAAPGGKTTALAEAMDDRGEVVAVDAQLSRLRLVERAVSRLGLTSVVPLVADGRRLPLRPSSFDRVLVDAPCSGFGVLRRRPEARWRIQPDAVDELAELQRELLGGAAAMVRARRASRVRRVHADPRRDHRRRRVGALGAPGLRRRATAR